MRSGLGRPQTDKASHVFLAILRLGDVYPNASIQHRDWLLAYGPKSALGEFIGE